MPRFFIDEYTMLSNEQDSAIITGENAQHISKSLRATVGESLILCNGLGYDYNCEISDISKESVTVKILNKEKSSSEPTVNVTIFQGMPKSDKLELIVQKCVEVGAYSFVPVLTKRCVSRPDEKSANKKTQRLNKISLEASKQSGRAIVPTVENMIGFSDMLNILDKFDLAIVFYEGGGEKIRKILGSYKSQSGSYDNMKIAVIIGPEGGLEESEVAKITQKGGKCATLGNRILRTETAPITALSVIMYETENI